MLGADSIRETIRRSLSNQGNRHVALARWVVQMESSGKIQAMWEVEIAKTVDKSYVGFEGKRGVSL